MQRFAVILVLLLGLLVIGFLTRGYLTDRALQNRGIRRDASILMAKILDAPDAFLPLRANGGIVSAAGFLAKAEAPRALTELRASNLRARCNLFELWKGKWEIETLAVTHLQAAFGPAAAGRVNRGEFADPQLFPPSQEATALEVNVRTVDVARTDLFWGGSPEMSGEFRDVHSVLYPQNDGLVVHGDSGTFQQAKWPSLKLEQSKLFYAKPDLRIDEATLTFGGASIVSALGMFHFAEQPSLDLQLSFAHCPVALFLPDAARGKVEAEFDGAAHLQGALQANSLRATGLFHIAKGSLKHLEVLRKLAQLTGRPEIAQLALDEVKGDLDWSYPVLTVRNFFLESRGQVRLKGEFTITANHLNGEFDLGLAPEIVAKFPGAREEIFRQSEGGFLWTPLIVRGTPDEVQDNLRPRLLRVVREYIARNATPAAGQGEATVEAIEDL